MPPMDSIVVIPSPPPPTNVTLFLPAPVQDLPPRDPVVNRRRASTTCITLVIFNTVFTLPVTLAEYAIIVYYLFDADDDFHIGDELVSDDLLRDFDSVQWRLTVLFFFITTVAAWTTLGALIGIKAAERFLGTDD